jgi:hypothetical protein
LTWFTFLTGFGDEIVEIIHCVADGAANQHIAKMAVPTRTTQDFLADREHDARLGLAVELALLGLHHAPPL